MLFRPFSFSPSHSSFDILLLPLWRWLENICEHGAFSFPPPAINAGSFFFPRSAVGQRIKGVCLLFFLLITPKPDSPPFFLSASSLMSRRRIRVRRPPLFLSPPPLALRVDDLFFPFILGLVWSFHLLKRFISSFFSPFTFWLACSSFFFFPPSSLHAVLDDDIGGASKLVPFPPPFPFILFSPLFEAGERGVLFSPLRTDRRRSPFFPLILSLC